MSDLTLQVVQGKHLSALEKRNIVALCTRAFEADMQPIFDTFTDPAHVLGFCDGSLVSHGLWITRWLQVGERPLLKTAYVEAVATNPDWRKRGFASAVMRRIATEIDDFELAALSPFDVDYYARLGWEKWQGSLSIRTKNGLQPSPADEEVMILRLPNTPLLDITQPLSAEWREGELW